MQEPLAESLKTIRDLALCDEICNDQQAPVPSWKCNSHIHLPPNFSAFQTVDHALALAETEGIGVLGVSNYYDFQVYAPFAVGARARGIFPLFGLEVIGMIDALRDAGMKINDPGNPGKIYLCGKGVTKMAPMNDEATRLMDMVRNNDSRRMSAMVQAVSKVFTDAGLPVVLTDADVVEMVRRRHGSPAHTICLQERHIAMAFQEALFDRIPAEERPGALAKVLGGSVKAPDADDAVSIQNAIRSALMKAGKPAFIVESFVGFDDAIALILALGGIPCYPTLADGVQPVCPFEADPQTLVGHLKERGMHAAELIPIRNTPEVLRAYVLALRDAGIMVTGGTEHNTLDLLGIEPTCVGGAPVPDDVTAVFREGACVVAAHQFLTLNSACGYVDAQGRLNSDFNNADQCIKAMANIGAKVIETYQHQLNP